MSSHKSRYNCLLKPPEDYYACVVFGGGACGGRLNKRSDKMKREEERRGKERRLEEKRRVEKRRGQKRTVNIKCSMIDSDICSNVL